MSLVLVNNTTHQTNLESKYSLVYYLNDEKLPRCLKLIILEYYDYSDSDIFGYYLSKVRSIKKLILKFFCEIKYLFSNYSLKLSPPDDNNIQLISEFRNWYFNMNYEQDFYNWYRNGSEICLLEQYASNHNMNISEFKIEHNFLYKGCLYSEFDDYNGEEKTWQFEEDTTAFFFITTNIQLKSAKEMKLLYLFQNEFSKALKLSSRHICKIVRNHCRKKTGDYMEILREYDAMNFQVLDYSDSEFRYSDYHSNAKNDYKSDIGEINNNNDDKSKNSE